MDVQQLIGTLSNLASKAGQDVKNKMNDKDLANPDTMLKAQFAVQQYSSFINYESAMINTIKNLLSGIISKI